MQYRGQSSCRIVQRWGSYFEAVIFRGAAWRIDRSPMKLAATAFKLRRHEDGYLRHITRWRRGMVCPNVVRVSGGDRIRESNYNRVCSFGASGLQNSMCDELMRFTAFLLALWLAVSPCGANGVSAAEDQQLQNVLEGIMQSCHDCHNSVTDEGGVSFEGLGDLSQSAKIGRASCRERVCGWV